MGGAFARVAAGAVAVYACLALLVDPSVFYEHGGYFPAFQYGAEFLRPFLSRPGGPSQYLAAYLAQGCADRWLGAAGFTALALLLGWGYGLALRYAAGKRALVWGTFPVLGAVLVWSRYGFHLDSMTALVLAVLGAAFYAQPRTGTLAPRCRAGLGMALIILGYWCCGGAVFVGVLLAAAVEHERRQQPRLAALFLLAGILTPVVFGHLCLGLPLHGAATCLLPYSDTSRLDGALTLCLLYGLAVLPAVMLLLKHRAASGRDTAAGSSGLPARLGWTRVPSRWRPVLGALAAAALVAVAWSPYTARRMAVMKHCRARDWERVLLEASRLPADRVTFDVSYAVNLALFHTGRLGDAMFAFPQGRLSLNLGAAFASCSDRSYYVERARTFFDVGLATLEMGLVNEAERVAHEVLEIYGPHPAVLRQLVVVNLVKRRPEAARVLLEALCLDPVARSWAKARLETLSRSPDELLNDELVAGARANLPFRQDSSGLLVPLAQRCLGQLDENPANRMAFEYLMAQYLITHDLEGFVRELPRAQAFGYRVLPRHYQEAVVLYEMKTRQEVAPWSAQVSPEIRDEFRLFKAAVAPLGGPSDRSRAAAAAAAFRGTYFYHYAFR